MDSRGGQFTGPVSRLIWVPENEQKTRHIRDGKAVSYPCCCSSETEYPETKACSPNGCAEEVNAVPGWHRYRYLTKT
jgi:hypothetical protein